MGFNVNIAFSGSLSPPMRDAEYLAAFRWVLSLLLYWPLCNTAIY